MSRYRRVVVLGFDGFEPSLVRSLLAAGEMPNLARLSANGSFGTLGTTLPAQTPVAFSTFATGTNPGAHGIFDFIRRDPQTYLPDLSLNRYEQKNAFTMPRAVNLRQGVTAWDLLRDAGVPATVLRCPCTYPADETLGNVLSGMGVPDLRGGLGTPTFYTSNPADAAKENENFVRVQVENGRVKTHLVGPRRPKQQGDMLCEIRVDIRSDGSGVTIRSGGEPSEMPLDVGTWSPWLKVKFKAGLLMSVRGMVRFLVVRTKPHFELYASPVNFVPASPMFPISSPAEYAAELEEAVGTYYTTGMVEDHGGLQNGRFDEGAYLAQCEEVLAERERMMHLELARLDSGLFFVLYDTPDRLQHMFWRFREPGHPANRAGMAAGMERIVEEHYRKCDALVGRALEHGFGDDTLFVVMSDHGFNSFQRGLHINSWLHAQGLLVLKDGMRPGADAGDLLRHVDWSRTAAYALGLGSIYLNRKGREAEGILDDAAAVRAGDAIEKGLTGLVDPERDTLAVHGVARREQVYSGPRAAEAPDLVVRFASGYRASWPTALGGVPEGFWEDNEDRWSGDHIIDPSLVPGVLLSNHRLDAQGATLLDMAPTILDALGVAKGAAMEGRSLLPRS
mgnify:CR=1 FL=1